MSDQSEAHKSSYLLKGLFVGMLVAGLLWLFWGQLLGSKDAQTQAVAAQGGASVVAAPTNVPSDISVVESAAAPMVDVPVIEVQTVDAVEQALIVPADTPHVEGDVKAIGSSEAAVSSIAADAVVDMLAVATPPVITPAIPQYAGVTVIEGVVQFYFAVGKADLADGAKIALTDAVQAAKRGRYLVVSGYHDVTGGVVFNEELAKQRALNVRAALMALGVPEDKIILLKPVSMADSGDDSKQNDVQARRVDVVIQDTAAYTHDVLLNIPLVVPSATL